MYIRLKPQPLSPVMFKGPPTRTSKLIAKFSVSYVYANALFKYNLFLGEDWLQRNRNNIYDNKCYG